MIFVLRKEPFTPEQTNEVMNHWPMAQPIIVPGRHVEPPYDALFAGTKSMAQIEAESTKRVNAVFDDSPFYFATERPWGMSTRIANGLMTLVSLAAVLLVGFVALGKPRGERRGPYAGSIVYFTSLAAGFIAVELALLQNLTLLLGHPIFTLSVLLFTLLASSGIGASLSDRVPPRTACLVVAVAGAVGALALPPLVHLLLPLSFSVRIAIAIVLIAPLGLAMGVPFPQGLKRVGHGPLPAPPFYWGLNGVMSVIGSVLTVTIAVSFGFRIAMLLGAAFYLIAAVASRSLGRPAGTRS
jgi:hypothetical protein